MSSLNLKTIFQKGLSFLFCAFLILSNLSAQGECNLDAPKNFEAYNISSTWLQLRWERVSNASGYWVETEDANSGAILSSQRITADSCKIEGLEPLNTYNFRIYTMCSEDEKSYLYTLLSSITSIVIENKPGGQYPANPGVRFAILNQNTTSAYISCIDKDYFCRAVSPTGSTLPFYLSVKSVSPTVISLNLIGENSGPLELCLPTPGCWGVGAYVVLSDNNVDILNIFPMTNDCGIYIEFVSPGPENTYNYQIIISTISALSPSPQDKSTRPNLGEPDTHYVQFDDRQPDSFKYFIYSMMGELVLKFESIDQDFNVLNTDQFEGLPAGPYVVNKRGKNLNHTNKIFKLR